MTESGALLFVFSQRFRSDGRDRLDPVLMALALDQPVRLLFTGAGVTHLSPVAHLPSSERPWTAALASLSLYGMKSAWVCEWSARRYGLDVSHTVMPVTQLNPQEVAQSIKECRLCL